MSHVVVNSQTPRVVYAGPGTTFAVPFSLPNAASLRVYAGGVLCDLADAPVGATEFSFSGTLVDGGYDGGSITFGAEAAGPVIIERAVPLERTSDFPYPSSLLDIKALNTALDSLIWIAQQVERDGKRALRIASSDAAEEGPILPDAATRANKGLGFDGDGNLSLIGTDPTLWTAPYSGAVPVSVADQLADRLLDVQFGALGDGVTDDTAALQALFTAAGTGARFAEIGDGTFRVTDTLTLPGAAAGLVMRGSILYDGPMDRPALVLGDAGAARNGEKLYGGLRVVAASQSDWSDEACIGILLRNLDASFVEVRQAEGFTIGVRTLGDERGFEDTSLVLGRLANNKIGLDIRSGAAAGWNNSVRYIGGHFSVGSAVNPTLDRFGVRLSAAAGAYTLHNSHFFEGPNFELNGTAGVATRIPFLNETNGRSVIARSMRMEACDAYVARHTGAAQDCIYEPVYVGTYAYTVGVDYAGATRAGGVVIPTHQAAVAQHTPRLIAAAENVRTRAFRWTAGETGFDQMAVLSTNPAGPPTTLAGLCFAGLDSITLNANDITLPTSRALAFVVDCAACKEFFIAAEGSDLRIVAMQFDAAESVLDGSKTALLSNQGMTFAGSPSFMWEANAASEDATLTRLQRVTLHADAAFAVLGVRGGSAAAMLKALRLYAPGLHAPRLLFGGARKWGTRELFASVAYDPPSIAAGAREGNVVSLPYIQGGDFVQASHTAPSAFIEWTASIEATGAAGTVVARAANLHSAAIDLGAGTLFVRAVKPRL